MMQSQAERMSNGDGPNPLSVEDAVGNAFIQLLAEEKGLDQGHPNNEAIQAFAKDVRRRKEQPLGSYDDFVELAASAAVHVLMYGSNSPDDNRQDPASLTLYRKMLWLVKRASSGIPSEFVPPKTRPQKANLLTIHSPVTGQQYAAENMNGLEGIRRFENAGQQELLNEAYDSGYSAGFEAGIQAKAAKHQASSAQREGTYAQGFAAGQRRLMDSEIAFAFARGQLAEQQRIRAFLDEGTKQAGQVSKTSGGSRESVTEFSEATRQTRPTDVSTTNTSARQYGHPSSRGSEFSHASPPVRPPDASVASGGLHSPPKSSLRAVAHDQAPAPIPEGTIKARRRVGRPRLHPGDVDGRHLVATCVFCGLELSQNSMLRHKRRHHAAELAAVGVPLNQFPCWWPGCGQLPDNLVLNQLTTHLQRKHNFTPPGESNAFTENLKYIGRMPIDLQISIIAEAAQQLNAVKLRIQNLETQLRRRDPSYTSQHGLPDIHHLHESRRPVLSAILTNRERLPLIVQELRQLTRARGTRSQMRKDEGTWWEVADDLEAAPDPSSKLAQAVIALSPPGDGPTVHLNLNVLSDPPNMNDPSWRPQYVLPLQPGWELEDLETDLHSVPVGSIVHRNNFRAVKPSPPHSMAVVLDEVEDEEEDLGYQKLMAEISRRVLDDKPQSDWDKTSSNEDGEDSGDAEDEVVQQAPNQPTRREGSGRRKRSVTTSSPPRRIKHRRDS
ncbi:hypothetical protein J7T55_012966 [Diaporthe amygdali]|uniref:uncharacterized protein n=1 Tax=Phomopsis amygdali TaxID=1214568 RepID=UPI0022FE73AB|nr:uncharacterized protein J7T55_012966 [Diaporthe amygdali]KAJ0118712.1 hypothetical protein J7T55_012966 [Diaporthe amygdali]